MSTKNFVVVGGSKGIGREIVQRLSNASSHVTVLSRTAEDLGSLPDVTHHEWDVTTETPDKSKLPDSIDGFVYCPGTINLRSFSSLKIDVFRDDFEVNVLGAVKAIQSALPGLKAAENSSIVMFSTVAVGQGMNAHASIAVSKGAIEGLVRTLAAELSPGIRVNCIAPALTNTSLTERFFKNPERAAALGEMYALQRTGTAADIAAMACLLLSEEGSWMTGQVIGIDGGMSRVRK